MFSKALREMDRNTELLMWDEMTNELEQLKTELKETKAEYETELNNTKAGYESELVRLRETIKHLQEEIQQNK